MTLAPDMCPVCLGTGCDHFSTVSTVDYLKCRTCGSLFAEPAFLEKAARGEAQTYREDYWEEERQAAHERCFGSTPIRVAETLLYCRRPVRRFLDIGAGSGHLLDALAILLPRAQDIFHAVEAFPPPPPHRTTHPNFIEGMVGDLTGPFDAGVCIEVIEHLVPDILRGIAADLARISAPSALYYFNSDQPAFVEEEDPTYLDPLIRGHVVAYSLAGLRAIFEPAGFNIITLPGRNWAFLAELGPVCAVSRDDLYARVWTALPENVAILNDGGFSTLLHTSGLEAARCYLELGRPMPPPERAPRYAAGRALASRLRRRLSG
jgi:hypothetical protein